MLFWCYDRQKKDGLKAFEWLIITNFRTVERRFSCKQKPVNALLSGIYGLFVDGRDRTARTLDTRFWRQCWNLSHTPTSPRFWGFVASRAADASRIDAFLMICEILHPIFDALHDESGFHGLSCGGNCGSVRRSKWQISNAQNLRRIKQRKGNPQHSSARSQKLPWQLFNKMIV